MSKVNSTKRQNCGAKRGIPRANNTRDKQNSKLYEQRIAHNLSQRELAERAGITRGTVMQIENGDCMPSMTSLKKICAALDVKIDDII